jgi:hypothetical protein
VHLPQPVQDMLVRPLAGSALLAWLAWLAWRALLARAGLPWQRGLLLVLFWHLLIISPQCRGGYQGRP